LETRFLADGLAGMDSLALLDVRDAPVAVGLFAPDRPAEDW
jgi:hypothetical protein